MTLEPAGTRSIFLNRNRDWCSNNHYTLNPSFFSADDKTLINLNSFKILLQACRHNNKLNTRTREGMKGKRSLQVFMRGRGVPSLHEALLKRSSILNLQCRKTAAGTKDRISLRQTLPSRNTLKDLFPQRKKGARESPQLPRYKVTARLDLKLPCLHFGQ